jgi:hypothetical protein
MTILGRFRTFAPVVSFGQDCPRLRIHRASGCSERKASSRPAAAHFSRLLAIVESALALSRVVTRLADSVVDMSAANARNLKQRDGGARLQAAIVKVARCFVDYLQCLVGQLDHAARDLGPRLAQDGLDGCDILGFLAPARDRLGSYVQMLRNVDAAPACRCQPSPFLTAAIRTRLRLPQTCTPRASHFLAGSDGERIAP